MKTADEFFEDGIITDIKILAVSTISISLETRKLKGETVHLFRERFEFKPELYHCYRVETITVAGQFDKLRLIKDLGIAKYGK